LNPAIPAKPLLECIIQETLGGAMGIILLPKTKGSAASLRINQLPLNAAWQSNQGSKPPVGSHHSFLFTL
jgi:hypothetical protein